jgi:uncharacterized repeat protein (TIGR03803 family)
MRPSRFLLLAFTFSALLLFSPATGRAQTFTDVLDFTGGSFADPGYVTLAQARNGDLYGSTTSQPGTGLGTLFGITPGGKIVLEYTGFDYTNGFFPAGGMTLGTDGLLYGTTEYSSYNADAGGEIYSLSTDGTYTALQAFEYNGDWPFAPPIEAANGYFYGSGNGYRHGIASAVYQYDSETETITSLHNFGTEVGLYYPLIQGIDGDLYGVANGGGSSQEEYGGIFRITTSGTLRYSLSFPGNLGIEFPNGPLIQLSDGYFYGTAQSTNPQEGGSVFKMSPAGDISIIYTFPWNTQQSWGPTTGLTVGSDGLLYGVTGLGGQYGYGTLYRITTSGEYTLLYSFPSYAPAVSPLVQHTNGKFYGVSVYGGAYNFGMIYTLDVNLAPFISLVQPQGIAGQSEQILGQGFTGATSVTFNGVASARFKVLNDTYMTAVVPSGATTGKVVVTTPSGALTSNVNFRVAR